MNFRWPNIHNNIFTSLLRFGSHKSLLNVNKSRACEYLVSVSFSLIFLYYRFAIVALKFCQCIARCILMYRIVSIWSKWILYIKLTSADKISPWNGKCIMEMKGKNMHLLQLELSIVRKREDMYGIEFVCGIEVEYARILLLYISHWFYGYLRAAARGLFIHRSMYLPIYIYVLYYLKTGFNAVYGW